MRLNSLVRVIGSRRFAMALMLSWMALIVIWVLPFELYGLPDTQIRAVVYREPSFRVVYVLLAFNTLACMLVHGAGVLRRIRQVPSATSSPRPSGGADEITDHFDRVRVSEALRNERFGGVVTGEDWAWGVRFRYSPLGTILFHAGIVVFIAAIAISFDPARLFEGSLVLAEGETFGGNAKTYIDRSEDASAQPPALSFSVESVRPRFYRDLLLFTGLEADVRSRGALHRIALSRPWIVSPTTVVALSDFGYALEVEGTGNAAEVPVNRVYKLKAFPSGQTDVMEIPVGGETYRVYVQVYGDYVDRGGKPGVRSFNARNPHLVVSVSRLLSASGERELVSSRLVPVGSSVSLPHGTLTFSGLRHYGIFRVIRNDGTPAVLLSLAMIVLGTVVRLAFPRTEALVIGRPGSADGGMAVEVRSDAYGTRSALTRRLAERVVAR